MKKLFIILFSIAVATGAAMAQKTFTFGPKIGVDYVHYWGENTDHAGRLAYQAGAFFEYRFSDKFSIAPELVFAAQGGKTDGVIIYDKDDLVSGYDSNAKWTYNMNYINLPVMLKFYATPELSIDLGPQLGVNVYHKATLKAGKTNYKETVDLKDIVNTIDVGIGFGLTYNITEQVFVQGRYTLGVTNVLKRKIYDSDAEYNHDYAKNGNAQIAIGFRF